MGTRLSNNRWIAKWQLLKIRIFGDTIKLILDLPQESFARFTKIRSKLADLRGKPANYNDVAVGAIDAYYAAVMAAEAGCSFVKTDAQGNKTPYEIF